MPSARMEAVSNDLLINPKKPAGLAMLDAGYAAASAKNPQQLKRSKGWKELMEDHLPDPWLLKKHVELLDSYGIDHMVFPIVVTELEVTDLLVLAHCVPKKFKLLPTGLHCWFFIPNTKARQEALTLAYKIKGKIVDSPDVNILADKVAVIVVEGGDAEHPDGNENIRSL